MQRRLVLFLRWLRVGRLCWYNCNMKLDPTKMKDWQIAEAAEDSLKPACELVAELGLQDDEWEPYGRVLAKVDVTKVLRRVGVGRRGKYIDVTAITPTALGEGKTTTTLGLVEGLGKIGKKVVGCVRQPSGGPTFNIKGSAAGGGLAQVVPLTSLSRAYGRYRRHYKRQQSGDGCAEFAHAARAQPR